MENIKLERLKSELKKLVELYANEPRKPERDKIDLKVKNIYKEIEKVSK